MDYIAALTYICVTKPKNMKASELKINDTFKRQGFKFTVKTIQNDSFKNGTPCILVGCTMGNNQVVDSYFTFKLDTKIK